MKTQYLTNNENIEENLKIALPYAEHFHISEPFLELIANNKTNHEEFAKTLKKLTKLKTEDLLNLRYEKYRKIGKMEE